MIAQNAGGSTSYYVYNVHGDTTSLLNSSGSVVRTYDNDSFGKSIMNFGTGATTPFRYNGQYTDIDTGLIYLRNRYYDPTTGRFTQEDPAKDGLNWYVYCYNDPVNMVDPWGLWMEGDENLSKGAQAYTVFYGRKWDEAYDAWSICVKAGDTVGAAAAQTEMASLHEAADDIRAKDAKGEVVGIGYDAPFYKQKGNTCQYYSAVIIENTGIENPLDYESAVKRAKEVEDEGWLTVEFEDSIKYDNISYETLRNALSFGAQRAIYWSITERVSHSVVLTGVFSAEGHPTIVTTVNPQKKGLYDKYRVQDIDEFKAGYLEDTYGFGGPLSIVEVVRKK